MKKYLKWIIAFLSFIIFIILGILVLTNNDIYLDIFVYKFISNYIFDDMTSFVKILTNLGSTVVVISISLLSLIILKNKKYGICLSIDLILITLFQLILKSIFARVRPIEINLIEQPGYSFPSGHSLTVMAFYGLIIYFIYKSSLHKKVKYIYITLFIFLIIIIGLSRIYLGVHYFTDVIGGFTFGLSFLIIYIYLMERISKGYFKK